MKKFTIKSLALTLALTLLATAAQTIPAEAKASPKIVGKSHVCRASWDLKGANLQFKVKNTNGKKVTWKTSNKAVATITSKGVLKPHKSGWVTISAKVGKKTLKKNITIHKHTFDYFQPNKGCKWCKHKTPSYFYSVKTARRDLKRFVKDITSPGKTSPEEVLFNFHEWEGELNNPTNFDSNDNWSTIFYVPHPSLPKTAYKYLPNWYKLDGMSGEDWDVVENKQDDISDEFTKPRYDKYGQQIPRVTMACNSFAGGYTGVCQDYAERAFALAHMLGLKTCLIESYKYNHEICLYKLNGKWILDDNGNFETGNMYEKRFPEDFDPKNVTKKDFKKGGGLASFSRDASLEDMILANLDEDSKDYEKKHTKLPADLRP